MDKPAPADLRTWAPPAFAWDKYGLDDDPRLQKRIDWAWGYIEEVTGRDLDTMDAKFEPIAEQALLLRVMQGAFGGGTAAVSMLEKPWIKSFTAGSYSETRFTAAELGGNAKDVLLKLNPWMELATLLWLLATEDKRDYWLEVFGGRIKPAGTFFEMDFSGARGAYGVEPYDEQGLVN